MPDLARRRVRARHLCRDEVSAWLVPAAWQRAVYRNPALPADGPTVTPLPLALWFACQAAAGLAVLHLAYMLICLRFLDHAERD